ncbi:MarR family winged helix-turn-helix transcriptional regulator [Demequina aestuarii]|uniref:MarR family winged helix-turn-helix transcriptional regulator n=1 Tax=Demequina aestuarii TaxID=327095 RepID=UPI00078420FF|nr:MarR family winged helix-turn-helix transcriptional regulator [Demequina aestuarii]
MTAEVAPAPSTALTAAEELMWRRFSAVLSTVPASLDEQLRAATGLNHFQYTVLDALSHQEGRRLQLAQIARAHESSLSRLSHSITRLENAGYVERTTCDHDRRANWAVLTDSGADVVERSRGEYTRIIRATLLDRVPVEHREALTHVLTALLPAEVAEQCSSLDADLEAQVEA